MQGIPIAQYTADNLPGASTIYIYIYICIYIF